jgi:predicted Zn-dependent peptidase
MHTAHDHFICGGRAFTAHDQKRFALFLLNNVLGGPGMNSRLNMNIREKFGYTYHIESGYHTFSDAGLFHVYFATERSFFEKCYGLVRRELNKLMHERVSEMRLSSYKYQLKGQIALGQENRAGFMLNNARNVLLYGKPMDVSQVMIMIDKVDSISLMEVANELFSNDKLSSLHYRSVERKSEVS